MKASLQRALYRFLRGAVAGAFGAMAMIVPPNIGNYGELSTWVSTLVIAGIVGFITGGLLALDKMYRDIQ